jgi:hypothetical protein
MLGESHLCRRSIDIKLFIEKATLALKQPPLWAQDGEVLNYIIDRITTEEFQKNPDQYMEQWALERGRTREYRCIEDRARGVMITILNELKEEANKVD